MIMEQYGDELDGNYLANDFINDSVDNDEMSHSEAWFLQGWKGAY